MSGEVASQVPDVLRPGVAVAALATAIDLEPLPADEVLEGAPLAGYTVLGELPIEGGVVEVGVWEMTEGVATDVEVDEIFLVLSGSATVVIEGVASPLELSPGVVVRLEAGMRAVWTVHERLRKLSIG